MVLINYQNMKYNHDTMLLTEVFGII